MLKCVLRPTDYRPSLPLAQHVNAIVKVVAIRTTRDIASHAGNEGMNDDLFWAAVTSRVPAIIQRLLDGAKFPDSR